MLKYDGYEADLISQIEDLLGDKDKLIAEYKKKRPAEDDDRYICEVIAAKFVYDNFLKR